MQIFKFPLKIADYEQIVSMPEGARCRLFAMQHRTPTMWAEVDPMRKVVPYKLVIIGTGQNVPPGGDHVGSTVDDRLGLVWHLYEIKAVP